MRAIGRALFPYWLLFTYFAAGALWTSLAAETQAIRGRAMLISGLIATTLMIGLRDRVGVDWQIYLYFFNLMRFGDFSDAIARGDFAYQTVNYIGYQAGAGIWLVNLVCGAIFIWGLYSFAATQRNPWLVCLVAVPYLIIVVAMNYTRQSVAIGIILAGLASMIRGKGGVLRFSLYVFAAALFHRTAICVLPLVALVSTRYRLINMVAVAVITSVLFSFLMSDNLAGFVRQYVGGGYTSVGAVPRIAMLVFAAVLYLAAYRKFQFDERERRVWLNFSVAALVALVLLFVSPSSTVIDRAALYLLPLQLAILPQIPYVYARKGFGTAAIVLYAGVVQFVWLNFAVYASYFIPYRWFNPLA